MKILNFIKKFFTKKKPILTKLNIKPFPKDKIKVIFTDEESGLNKEIWNSPLRGTYPNQEIEYIYKKYN